MNSQQNHHVMSHRVKSSGHETVSSNAGLDEYVILLHGLARTGASMRKMESVLKGKGYRVLNLDYPSRTGTIESLTMEYLEPAVSCCQRNGAIKIHFVTHSMGGILVRYYLSQRNLSQLGHVVMLSPPNKGSEVVDKLKQFAAFDYLNGPAGQQMGTDKESFVNRLGPVHYPVGIITGNKSINPLLSLLIPGEDDGKVSVERARLQGMSDFLVVPYTHTLLMNNDRVIRHATDFLSNGHFTRQYDHTGSG